MSRVRRWARILLPGRSMSVKAMDGGSLDGGPDAHSPPHRSLDELAECIRTCLADVRRAEALGRFAMGDQVHTVRYGPASGLYTIRELAERAGVDESGLRRLGRTSEGIRPKDRNLILSLTNRRGLPLTWSHLEEIARIRNGSRQIDIARMALSEGFTVEVLRRYVSEQDTVSQRTMAASDALDDGPSPGGLPGTRAAARTRPRRRPA